MHFLFEFKFKEAASHHIQYSNQYCPFKHILSIRNIFVAVWAVLLIIYLFGSYIRVKYTAFYPRPFSMRMNIICYNVVSSL